MVLNSAGILAVFEVIARPYLLIPRLIIKDIRQLDLKRLRARGITGVVVDKDNCLTRPKHDKVVPELKEAWPTLVSTFGQRNVLIVSNSAGTRDDAGLLQAESVSRHLGVPVLLHSIKKPGCAQIVAEYFQPSPPINLPGKGKEREDYPSAPVVNVHPSIILAATSTSKLMPVEARIMVIGDRVMTDIVLANRINRLTKSAYKSLEAIPVLTTTVWESEGGGSRLMRALETFATKRVLAFYKRRRQCDPAQEWKDCITEQKTAVSSSAPDPTKSITLRRRLIAFCVATVLPLRHFYSVRQQRAINRINNFWMEGRQAQYGFQLPNGILQINRLRGISEGSNRGKP